MLPLAYLLSYIRPHRYKVMVACICTALSTIFDLLPDILIGMAVDVVSFGEGSFLATLGIQDVSTQLTTLGIAACIIWFLEAIFEFLYAYLWRNLAQSIQHAMRLDAYDHVQQLSMAYYEDATTGSLLAILNDDINQLERFLDVGVYKFIYLMTTTLAVGVIFLYLAPTIALYALLPLPIIVMTIFSFKRKLSSRYALVRSKVAAIANRITNNILGIVTIKSYTSEHHERERVNIDSNNYQQANNSVIPISAAFMPMVRLIVVIAFTATVIVGGWSVLNGTLAVGAYSILVFQTQRLLWPATELADMIDLYERAKASAQRVYALVQIPIENSQDRYRLNNQQVQGTIEYKNIVFRYGQQPPVFKRLTCTIESGSVVAFVGPTGAGKSTLIKLLLRFYDPQAGVILLDGQDITMINASDIRRAVSLVSQEVFLFYGTVRENIAYGTFDASYKDIIHAASIAQAHEFIMRLPQGYDTMIGEHGKKLSGGQRQRLSIARAVLKNAPIFIFDEATSSVDNETETAIQQALMLITARRTVIMIAHRLSTICMADTIFVMDKGAIVESGTHEQLLGLPGVYSRLWAMQTSNSGLRGSSSISSSPFVRKASKTRQVYEPVL